jgi:hypothetical protein
MTLVFVATEQKKLNNKDTKESEKKTKLFQLARRFNVTLTY